MTFLKADELRSILTKEKLTIYDVDFPHEFNGFRFSTLNQFIAFIKENKIKNCFLSLTYSTIDDYIILDEMVKDVAEPQHELYKKILKKVHDYNNTLKSIDFSPPQAILIATLYQGHCFYFGHLNKFLLCNEPLLEPEEKLDEILVLFEREIDEEISKKNQIIEEQKTKLREYIQNDPDFKLCKNKNLRKSYIHNLFRSKLGSNFKELKSFWCNSDTGFVYRGAIEFAELVWNEIKNSKQ